MKQSKSLATMLVAASMFTFLISCGSGEEKKAEDAAKDAARDTAQTKATVSAQTVAPAPVMQLTKVVVITQKVANYAKWKPAYDAHDSARKASGLTSYVVGRGSKDSNTVVVVLKMDDLAKAKAFGSSKDLKTVMQKAGVVGAPTINYLDVVYNDNTKIEQTDRLRVTHKVKDFNAWKTEFDSHKDTRIAAGLVDRAVGHSFDDPNWVEVVFAITDMKKADEFLKSKDLKDKMAKAGVVGAPTFLFYKNVEVIQ